LREEGCFAVKPFQGSLVKPVAYLSWSYGGCELIVEGASRLDNAADEEYPLIARRKAPHNQRIEQTPFGRSSSAAFIRYNKIENWRGYSEP
jgi:hypothetical protein